MLKPLTILIVGTIFLSGCSSTPIATRDMDNICYIFDREQEWKEASQDSYRKWGTPGVLQGNEVLVKLWSENSVFKSLLDSPYFEDTGKRIPTGYVEAHVWRVLDDSVFKLEQ